MSPKMRVATKLPARRSSLLGYFYQGGELNKLGQHGPLGRLGGFFNKTLNAKYMSA
jgi:hypothetical protein